MRIGLLLVPVVVWSVAAMGSAAGGAGTGRTTGTLTVDAGRPGPRIGPLFYGLTTEEINHAYDGGLYAELIQNRSFQQGDLAHWSLVASTSATGRIVADTKDPVNGGALKTTLRFDAINAASDRRVGVANEGYWGIPVWPDTRYRASFYARASAGFNGPLIVCIESNDGATTFASATVRSVGREWKKYEVELRTKKKVPTSAANRFAIYASGKGSVWLSLVSLFPPTYHDRPNGNRVDLMQKMADLHPAYVRFPGGNSLEGETVETRFDWKKTTGALEERPGHMGCWGYYSSDGLGLLEFLEWCEDLHAEPLLAVYSGYSTRGEYVKPGPDLRPFVEDALDEIEYVTGQASKTKWGARRAKDGHPEPFPLHYVEIGNQDNYDQSGSYERRFVQLSEAIKDRYPQLRCISSAPVESRRPDLVDDHQYVPPARMRELVHRYRGYSAKLPRVMVSEWATQNGSPTPTFRAALADAAWLTGLQQDADVVAMNSYAPLLVNVNNGAWQFPTSLIGYDAVTSFGSPSYYAQAMFSRYRGDTVLPVEVAAADGAADAAPSGAVGVGTWHTAAVFKDVKVTHGDRTLFASDFSAEHTELAPWRPGDGKWRVRDGALEQTDESRDTRILAGDANWQDYTLSLSALKLGGDEGFLILFHVLDSDDFLWLNVGGWGNSRTAIEKSVDGEKVQVGESADFTVEENRWYDVRIEVRGRDIKCFIDNELVIQATDPPPGGPAGETLFAAASRDDGNGSDVCLQVVNAQFAPRALEVNVRGVASVRPTATVEVLSGAPTDVNSTEEPTRVAPRRADISDAAVRFVHEFPANSVTVMRLRAK